MTYLLFFLPTHILISTIIHKNRLPKSLADPVYLIFILTTLPGAIFVDCIEMTIAWIEHWMYRGCETKRA